MQVLSPQAIWNNRVAIIQLWLLRNAKAQSMTLCIFKRNVCGRGRFNCSCYMSHSVGEALLGWLGVTAFESRSDICFFLPSKIGQSHPTVAVCCVFSESPIHSHRIIIVFHQARLCHALVGAGTIFRVTVTSSCIFLLSNLCFITWGFCKVIIFIAPFLSSLFHFSLPSHSPTWSIC